VVAEHGERRGTPLGKLRINRPHLIAPAVVMTDEVSGEHDDVRTQRGHSRERLEHVTVGYAGSDVNITDLHERTPCPPRRQSAHRQRPVDDLEPMRLDAPCIQTHRRRGTCGGDAEKTAAACHPRRQEPIFLSAFSLSRKVTPLAIHGAAGSSFR
jgi:hypothetical protein